MKKGVLFGMLIASAITLNSCGGGGSSETTAEAKTVELTGQLETVMMGQTPLIVAVGKYTDNYVSEDIASLVKEGKKIIEIEIYVSNNGENSINVPPASFTLDDATTDAVEEFGVNSLISMKLDDFTVYDGDVGSTYAKGVLYFEVDAATKAENLKMNIRNTMNGDEHVASIPLKQKDGVNVVEENTELKLAESSISIEDNIFDGKGTLTVGKVIENFIGEEENMEAPYTQYVKVEYTIAVEAGSIYCSSSSFKLKSNLLEEPVYASDDELESGSLKQGEERKGFAVFSVPVGDAGFTLVYDNENELKLN